jgi:hypothetical protein
MVKKLITVFMMGFALMTSTYAQVTCILKIGPSYATVSFDDDLNRFGGDFHHKSKVGLIIGMGLEIPLGQDFSLQPELLFHQKGFTSEYVNLDVTESRTHTYNYLEMPLFAKMNFGNFYAAVGPYLSLGVGGKYKGTLSYTGQTQHFSGDVKFGEVPDNYNGQDLYLNVWDFGLQMAVGVKISGVVIDLRFGAGVTDINDTDYSTMETLNRSLQLTIGLPIRGKH